MSAPQRQAFEAFAAKFCGVPYADLVRGETTGLAFGWACWQEAQSALVEEIRQNHRKNNPQEK